MVAGRKAKMFPDAGMWVDVLKEVSRNCFLLLLFFFFPVKQEARLSA